MCTPSTFPIAWFPSAVNAPTYYVEGNLSMLPSTASCTAYDASSTVGGGEFLRGALVCSENVTSLSRAVADADAKVRAREP